MQQPQCTTEADRQTGMTTKIRPNLIKQWTLIFPHALNVICFPVLLICSLAAKKLSFAPTKP